MPQKDMKSLFYYLVIINHPVCRNTYTNILTRTTTKISNPAEDESRFFYIWCYFINEFKDSIRMNDS